MFKFFLEQWSQLVCLINGEKIQQGIKPAPDDLSKWRQYWAEKGWPWRREPEISQERQRELAQRRLIPADIEQDIYPFGGVELTRADIEWLLVTHDNGRGPVDWSDEQQRECWGLDLRGACVAEGTSLGQLPLTRLQGGIPAIEISRKTKEQQDLMALRLPRVNLSYAHLEGAQLARLHLEETDLSEAHLQEADLSETNLEGAYLSDAHLEGACLFNACLQDADLWGACLQGATLSKADLKGANLGSAHLENAQLFAANLEGANLRKAHLEGAKLEKVTLADVNGVGPSLADAHWGETSLFEMGWSRVKMLGDEQLARQKITSDGRKKDRAERQQEYHNAHRANHQLAVVLQEQGLTFESARFAYRAKCLERKVLWYRVLLARKEWREKKNIGTPLHPFIRMFRVVWFWVIAWPLTMLHWAGSYLLFGLAGYGYRFKRWLVWYVGIVLLFMMLYRVLEPGAFPGFTTALAESVNVFHGRGVAPNVTAFRNAVLFARLTIVEATVGLLIEVVFVATMIQRLFGK